MDVTPAVEAGRFLLQLGVVPFFNLTSCDLKAHELSTVLKGCMVTEDIEELKNAYGPQYPWVSMEISIGKNQTLKIAYVKIYEVPEELAHVPEHIAAAS